MHRVSSLKAAALAAIFIMMSVLILAKMSERSPLMLFSKWKMDLTLPNYYKPRALWANGQVQLVLCRFQTLEQQLQTDLNRNRASFQAVVLLKRVSATGEAHWHKVYEQRGDFHALSAANSGNLFALGSTYETDGSETGFLLHSADGGQSWTPLPPPPAAARGLAFYTSTNGYAWTASGVFQTHDQGQTWSDLKISSGILDEGAAPAVDENGTLVSGTADKLRVRAVDGRLTEVALPPRFRLTHLAAAGERRIWLLGSALPDEPSREEVLLLCWRPGQLLEQVAKFPALTPERLFVSGSSLVVAAAEAALVPPKTHFLISSDLGRRWRDEVPPIAVGMDALFLARDGTVWTAGPAGRLQKRVP